ncbi:MAG: hypothetical protein NT004_06165 [Bacteroidetes bacterium]|nr:hypothetical protein [Bacteroidota bacterium]
MRFFLLILTGGLLLLSSCSKKDFVTYTPVNHKDTSGMPPLFPDAKLKMMSEFEKNKKASLHGHLLTKAMGGIDPFAIGFAIFGILSNSIESFENQEMMNDLNTRMNALSQQDSILLSDIAELSNFMNYSTTEIVNQINNSSANSKITEIMTAMGGGDQMGLRWFCQAGANYQNHVPGFDSNYIANYVTPAAHSFYNYYYNNATIDDAFNELTNLISSPALPLDSSSLVTFSRLLIGQFASHDEGASNSIMNTYMFLEYYYLTMLTYQMQAATVWMNLLKASPDTNQATNWWNTAGIPGILNGANMFLKATDYLLINLAEYRNQSRWSADMKYSGLWMAPNSDLANALARAQFQIKLITMGLNQSSPEIFGSIITPNNYCTSPPRVQAGAASYNLPQTSYVYPSRLPYPAWIGNTCTPDNHWIFYNYGFGSGLNCQPWNINIMPTWAHSSAGSGYGTITPLWYNPRDPDQTSVIKTDSCTVQFAYFCVSWQWGIMLTDYLNTGSSSLNNNLALWSVPPFGCCACWQCGNGVGGKSATVPFIAQEHDDETGVNWENIQTDAIRSFGRNGYGLQSPFKYNMTVNLLPYPGGKTILADQIAGPAINMPDLAPNGDIEIWTNYSTNFMLTPMPATLEYGNFQIGSALVDGSPKCPSSCSTPAVYYSGADIINWGGSYSSGLYNQTGFVSQQILPGYHAPNFQYTFSIDKSSNTTLVGASLWLDMQVVFGGFFGY